jgi:hypothetical protein
MRKLLFLALAAVIFSCGSCSKDGAAGPAGADGATGGTGPAGPAGPAGADGAGIIYSDWLDVAYDPLVGAADDDGIENDTVAWETIIPADKLTSDILTTGEVKVYLNTSTAADPVIHPLPYTDLYFGQTINPTFYAGEIYLFASNNFATGLDDNGVKSYQYRYILIPGGTAARKSAAGKKVDWNNYAEVKAYLKLKD